MTNYYIAYTVKEREDKPNVWVKLGAMFPHKDGKGFTLKLDAVPLDETITLRIAEDKEQPNAT